MSQKKPSIVFLDAATVDFGGVSIRPIKSQGHYTPYDSTEPIEIYQRVSQADIVVTNKCVFNDALLKRLPRLKLICVAATGVNNIDLESAKKRGIAVTNVAGYSTTTVVEHTFLFLLAFSHRLMEHHTDVTSGLWSQSPHFTLLDYPFSDLKGKTLGIIGYGIIGKQVAKMAKTFGMKVLPAKIPRRKYRKNERRYPLKQVLQKSSFVSLHCTLVKETHHLIDQEKLSWMKPSAYLLNLARGPIVSEEAVLTALKKNQIAGYATDVMDREPPSEDHPFVQPELRKKILITPHIAWASRESRQRLIDEIAKNIAAFLKGKKRNRVD